MKLGAHESTAGGLHNAFENAAEDGCDSLQIFCKSARRWKAKPYDDQTIEAWKTAWEASDLRRDDVVVHNSYLINLCATKDDVRKKSIAALIDELQRCQQLGIRWLNMHPGSHVGSGEATGIERIVENLDRCIEEAEAPDVDILLENTAGQGTNLGYKFEHLRDIIAGSEHAERLYVCIDTCHALAAGYDIRTAQGCEETFGALDEIVGLDRLAALHLNDSKHELGSKKDRHEQIGEGAIGIEGFRWMVNADILAEVPGILETPPLDNGDMSYAHNLRVLRDQIEA